MGETAGMVMRDRIEIVHESLLASWPRLVRWQSQDAGGAVLRDHLRQSAQVWEERSRPDDLLWSGTAYREYKLWREQYAGSLSAVEQSFTEAMTRRAERRKRRLAFSTASALAVAVAIAIVMTTLWRRSEAQTRRAEGQKLLALAQVEIDRYPTAALAYARASVSISDTDDARKFAVGALWRNAAARILQFPATGTTANAFIADGRAVALIAAHADDRIIPNDGGEPRLLDNPAASGAPFAAPSPDGRYLVTTAGGDQNVHVFHSSGRLIRSFPRNNGRVNLVKDGIIVSMPAGDSGEIRAVIWPYENGESRELENFRPRGPWAFHDEGWLAHARDSEIYRHGSEQQGPILRLNRKPDRFWFWRGYLVAHSEGGIEFVELNSGRRRSITTEITAGASYAASHGRLSAVQGTNMWSWSLDDPGGTDPLRVTMTGIDFFSDVSHHPSGRWIVTSTNTGAVLLWPLSTPRSRVIRLPQGVASMEFSPDGRRLAVCGEGSGLRFFELNHHAVSENVGGFDTNCIAVAHHPSGERLIAGIFPKGAYEVSAARDIRQLIDSPQKSVWAVAWDQSGRRVAAYVHDWSDRTKHEIVVIDRETAFRKRIPIAAPGSTDGAVASVLSLAFGADGHLYSAGEGGLRRWDLTTGGSSFLTGGKAGTLSLMSMSRDGRSLLVATGNRGHWSIEANGDLQVLNLDSGAFRRIEKHGSSFLALAFDGETIVTADMDGMIRVGTTADHEPHLLIGETSILAISPDRKWIASANIREVRLWPMPDLESAPLHRLGRDELLRKLDELTNLRATADHAAPNGYRLEAGPFPGWRDTPSW